MYRPAKSSPVVGAQSSARPIEKDRSRGFSTEFFTVRSYAAPSSHPTSAGADASRARPMSGYNATNSTARSTTWGAAGKPPTSNTHAASYNATLQQVTLTPAQRKEQPPTPAVVWGPNPVPVSVIIEKRLEGQLPRYSKLCKAVRERCGRDISGHRVSFQSKDENFEAETQVSGLVHVLTTILDEFRHMEEESLLLKDVLSCDIQLSEFITVLDAYRAREQEPRKETLERGIQTASLPVTRTSASQTSQYVNPVVEKTVLRKSRNASVGGNEPIPVLIDRVTQCRPWDEIVREYENSIGELQERVKAVGIAWEERVARVTKAHDTVVSRLDDNISELKSENVSLRATNMEGNLRERKLQTEVFQRSEECQQLQTRIEELRREIERGNHRCYDLEVQIKRLEDEGAQCRHALGTEKAQSSFFQTKLRDTENTVEILQARIAETDRLLSMTKANQESLEHSVTEKNHELKSIRSQMEETQTEMVQTQTENEKLVESSMELERMVQNLVAKNRELMSMIEILQWEEGDNMGLGLNDVPFTRDTDHILHQMIARNNVRISLLEEKNRELRHKRSELVSQPPPPPPTTKSPSHQSGRSTNIYHNNSSMNPPSTLLAYASGFAKRPPQGTKQNKQPPQKPPYRGADPPPRLTKYPPDWPGFEITVTRPPSAKPKIEVRSGGGQGKKHWSGSQ